MWCGVVWCGVVWCGVVWCGVVWCGVVWCGVVLCGVVGCGVAWRGVVWRGVVWLSVFTLKRALCTPLFFKASLPISIAPSTPTSYSSKRPFFEILHLYVRNISVLCSRISRFYVPEYRSSMFPNIVVLCSRIS